jgi:ComF family protein
MDALEQSGAVAARLARHCLDALLPPRCPACRSPVSAHATLCVRCWNRLTFLAGAGCPVCGDTFQHASPPGTRCAACLRSPPPYTAARAALRYDDASRDLVLGFKHGDRTELAVPFGRWMAMAGRAILATGEMLVPVPLHRARLLRRRYNQAALLAAEIARTSGVRLPVHAAVLVRRRPDRSQSGLGRSARRRNVAGAFSVRDSHRPQVAGRHIVLVDDVQTTGATVAACARALLDGGAASVAVLTLARVVRESSRSI